MQFSSLFLAAVVATGVLASPVNQPMAPRAEGAPLEKPWAVPRGYYGPTGTAGAGPTGTGAAGPTGTAPAGPTATAPSYSPPPPPGYGPPDTYHQPVRVRSPNEPAAPAEYRAWDKA